MFSEELVPENRTYDYIVKTNVNVSQLSSGESHSS